MAAARFSIHASLIAIKPPCTPELARIPRETLIIALRPVGGNLRRCPGKAARNFILGTAESEKRRQLQRATLAVATSTSRALSLAGSFTRGGDARLTDTHPLGRSR